MKNHVKVNGRLLQTNKKFSDLKMKQKEKISEMLYEEFKEQKVSGKLDIQSVVNAVYEKIREAEIWIPECELRKYFSAHLHKYNKRFEKESENKKQL